MGIGCIFPGMVAYRFYGVCSILFIIFCLSTPVCGQSNTRILEHTVKFSNRSVRLDTLLQSVTRQTGIRFSYNSRRLNTSYQLRLPTNSLTVHQVLDELKYTTGVLYTVIENQVILNIEKSTVQKPVKQEAKPENLQPKPNRSLAAGVAVTHPALKLSEDSMRITSDSSFRHYSGNSVAPLPDSIIVITQPSLNKSDQPKIDSVVQKPKALPVSQKRSPKKQKFFIDVGVSAEETLFMGATLQGGIPAIFASVSVKSNSKSIIFLYGLSTSLRVREKSKIILTVQYGSYAKAFTHTEINTLDSTGTTHQVGVKNTWGRVGTGMEWKLNKKGNLKFYTGLNFNILESRYTVNGENSGLGVLSVSDPEREFSAFYPFYTITNTYADSASKAVKTWIGIQVGINYTIFHR
jgi:hypothetical protein